MTLARLSVQGGLAGMVAGALLGVATLVEGLLAASVAEAADAGIAGGALRGPWAANVVEPDIEFKSGLPSAFAPWAKPYCKGQIKVLVIAGAGSRGEVAELAGRSSVDARFVAADGPAGVARLKGALEDDSLDVIVMNAAWDLLGPEAEGLARKRVGEGVGLVVISPRRGAPAAAVAAEALPEGDAAGTGGVCEWQRSRSHFLTTGFPFEVMRTHVTPHAVLKGRVLAEGVTDGARRPLIVAGALGKGRVVCLNYGGADMGGGLAPAALARDGGAGAPGFAWQEYAWSLVIRCIVWAAGREGEVLIHQLGVADPAAPALSVRLSNSGGQKTLAFDVTVRDALSAPVSRKRVEMTVGPGMDEVAIPLERGAGQGGRRFVDLIVRSRGEVVNWGSAVFVAPRFEGAGDAE
ncbi:MAG TPA: hypothetical protein P5137_17435 [Candidatus Brocadiia bacterium]|nr:hypothetical protein [Candidatus Brocadiia bacterium]